jgi:hypothetical protein
MSVSPPKLTCVAAVPAKILCFFVSSRLCFEQGLTWAGLCELREGRESRATGLETNGIQQWLGCLVRESAPQVGNQPGGCAARGPPLSFLSLDSVSQP